MEEVTVGGAARSRRLALLLALAAWPASAGAHRLDECLQATLVSIGRGEVRLDVNLNPGVAVAGPLVAAIDVDHDGAVSASEAAAYAERLRRDLSIRLDGREVELVVLAVEAPAAAELRSGWGIIQVRLSARFGPLADGLHTLAVENRHLPDVSVYLLNAALPRSPGVRITRQSRNDTQTAGEIEFALAAGPTRPD